MDNVELLNTIQKYMLRLEFAPTYMLPLKLLAKLLIKVEFLTLIVLLPADHTTPPEVALLLTNVTLLMLRFEFYYIYITPPLEVA